jgi:hypothetical protein
LRITAEKFGGFEALAETKPWKSQQEAVMDILDEYGCKTTTAAVRKFTREEMGMTFLEF